MVFRLVLAILATSLSAARKHHAACHVDCCMSTLTKSAQDNSVHIPKDGLEHPATFCSDILDALDSDPCGYLDSGATKNIKTAKLMCTCFNCKCGGDGGCDQPTPAPTPKWWYKPKLPGKFFGAVEIGHGMTGVPKKDVFLKLGVTSKPPPGGCGTQPRAKEGSVVTVQYISFLYFPAKKIHSEMKVDASFRESSSGSSSVTIGDANNMIIKGLDAGIRGMCTGEKRTLIIPPWLAYGSVEQTVDWTDGHSAYIPPHSWLVYYVKCLSVK